jgi:hypothetical protein
VAEITIAEGQTQRPSNPFCVLGEFQTGFIFRGQFMKIVCSAEPTENGLLLHYPSKEIKQQILHLYEGAKENYNGYLKVDLQKPYKSRTTGEGSQNNLFYLLVTEICKETGNDIEDVKDALKEKAIKRGYPYKINRLTGRIRPASTTKVNTVEMGYLIDEAKQELAELGINPDNF